MMECLTLKFSGRKKRAADLGVRHEKMMALFLGRLR